MNIRKFLIKLISTFFYAGYFPLIPGTFGSLAGVFLFYFIRRDQVIYVLSTLFLILLGFWVSTMAEDVFGKKDPKYVVIDEVCGMLLSLAFLPFYSVQVVCIAFLLFRILDTLKPYPAGRLERLNGGMGIMLDDLVAGVYANVVLQVVMRWLVKI